MRARCSICGNRGEVGSSATEGAFVARGTRDDRAVLRCNDCGRGLIRTTLGWGPLPDAVWVEMQETWAADAAHSSALRESTATTAAVNGPEDGRLTLGL